AFLDTEDEVHPLQTEERETALPRQERDDLRPVLRGEAHSRNRLSGELPVPAGRAQPRSPARKRAPPADFRPDETKDAGPCLKPLRAGSWASGVCSRRGAARFPGPDRQ